MRGGKKCEKASFVLVEIETYQLSCLTNRFGFIVDAQIDTPCAMNPMASESLARDDCVSSVEHSQRRPVRQIRTQAIEVATDTDMLGFRVRY